MREVEALELLVVPVKKLLIFNCTEVVSRMTMSVKMNLCRKDELSSKAVPTLYAQTTDIE